MAETHTTLTIVILCAALLLFGGILLTFKPRFPAVVLTYCSLWLLKLGGLATVTDKMLISWGLATALVVVITLLLPRDVVRASQGVNHIAVATLAGAIVGAVAATVTSIILGAFTGALLGIYAFSRTDTGRNLATSSQKFINYTLAKAMPAIVNFSMAGLFIALIL